MGELAASACDLRVGTSGYDWPEWEGPFYARGLGRSEYLGAYSEVFGTLELGAPGDGRLAAGELLSRTRRPIDFSVKAPPALAGRADPAGLKSSARALALAVEPLAAAGRLCAVLLCFPASFRYRDDERRYLGRLLDELGAFPLVVEFRGAEWFSSRVIEGLKARRVGLCSVDLPRIEGLPPVSDIVTAELAYVRFHGRNEAAWRSGDERARLDYGYATDELAAWLPRLEAMSVEAARLRVFFTNRARGGAPAGARELLRLAEAARLIRPESPGGAASALGARSRGP